MKNPLSVAATVLKPYDSASLYEKEGQMKLQPLLEKKQKMQQAESEFANVMAEIDKYSSDVWEQDWQQVSKMKDEFLDNASRVYEDAHFNGRDLSITERYQMQKGLGELAQKATMSKANKTFYEKTAYQIMTNPDKYDVEASMYLLNKGYKEGQLGARSVGNFMVPRYDPDAFRKGVVIPYIETGHTGERGGSKVKRVDEAKLATQIILKAQNDQGVMQRLQSMTPEQQAQWLEGEVQYHVSKSDYSKTTTTKTPSGEKEKVPLVRTTEDLGKGDKYANYEMDVAGTDGKQKVKTTKGAKVVRISPEGTMVSTTKGMYYVQGVFRDNKGNLYAYGNEGEIDAGVAKRRKNVVAIPYGEIGAGIERETGYTKRDIEQAFGGQQTGGGVGSKYKGQ